MGMGKQWNRVWIFYHSRLRVFRVKGIRVLIRYHLRLSWRPWILKVQYSYQRVFWFCPSKDQRFLYQWCNVLWRSCLRHLLFLRSIILGGIIICKYQFWLHRWRLVLNRGKRILVRVFRLRFRRRKCWMHHHHLRLFCQMAFIRLVEYHVQGRRVPSRRYLLGYQLIHRELKWLLSLIYILN